MVKNISLIILGVIIFFLLWTLYGMVDGREKIISLHDSQIIELKKQYSEVELDRDNLYGLYFDERTNRRWDQMRNFDTLKELELFLMADKTNEAKFIEDIYDCDDFAITLQENAAKKGYRISLQVDINSYEVHMYNTAIVEAPKARVILIEPQTDEIIEGPYLDSGKR